MLSAAETPEASDRPPDVHDPQRARRDELMEQLLGKDSLPNVVPEMPQPTSTAAPATVNYKASLNNNPHFKNLDLPEEIASEDEESDELANSDCPRIKITKEDKERIRRPLRRTLIIKLLGRTVGYGYLSRRLRTLWKPEAHMELIDLDQDYYLARFESQNDYDAVRFVGPWMILDHYLLVQEWRPKFNPLTDSVEKILVWVRLPTISIEYFDEVILMRIGNNIGRAIKVDITTGLATRGKFARIYVEIDLSKPLLAKFEAEEECYPVEY
ncbi:PREDICTED: uncharacterized protein LOC109151954 [Ipomoea nil]|uniref:uncharacterized protein LOC109151954 n=1 Tax=Ipomoea nil TaxID=35883 RepID=UPI000900EC38|nr:PREDICTED: uncharacterized protein LOC109151954 [Ipomoea nil]